MLVKYSSTVFVRPSIKRRGPVVMKVCSPLVNTVHVDVLHINIILIFLISTCTCIAFFYSLNRTFND